MSKNGSFTARGNVKKRYVIKQGKNINILNKCLGGLNIMGVILDAQDGHTLK
jgi:hypothetical protein